MADDSKVESIKVKIKNKSDDEEPKTSTAQKKGGGYLSAKEATDDDTDTQSDKNANRQGKVIQPSAAAKQAAATEAEEDEETETTPDTDLEDEPTSATENIEVPDPDAKLNSPVKSDPLPGDHDADNTSAEETESTTDQEPTVAAHASMQRKAIKDNRDYKIDKKALKKAPQTTSSIIHSRLAFGILVLVLSVGLAYIYLSAVEGMTFEDIISRLGL